MSESSEVSPETSAKCPLRERIEAAWCEVSRVCLDGDWRMTVPVDENRDSDMVIGAGLTAGSDALARAEAAEAEVARLRDGLGRLADEWDRGPSSRGPVDPSGRLRLILAMGNHQSATEAPRTRDGEQGGER